jgi:hypothetical protein
MFHSLLFCVSICKAVFRFLQQMNKLFYFIQLTYYEKSLRAVLVFKWGVNNEDSQPKGRGFESRRCLLERM